MCFFARAETIKCPHQGQTVRLYDCEVIDGDTVKGTIGWRHPVRWSIRLFGWDCNESGTEEGEAATRATQALLTGKTVWVNVVKHDKYGGRLVGNIMVGRFRRVDLGRHLMKDGLARSYNGRGPKPW